MKNLKCIVALMFLTMISSPLYALSANGSYTLGDVIKSEPRIKNQKPSTLIAPITGDFIRVGNDWYQVRLFFFETDVPSSPLDNLSFSEFIEQNDLLLENPQSAPGAIIATDHFTATSNIKDSGTNFLLSLRKIEDESLLSTLNANQPAPQPLVDSRKDLSASPSEPRLDLDANL